MYAVHFKTRPDFFGNYQMGYIGMRDGLWIISDEPIQVPLEWVEKAIKWYTMGRFFGKVVPNHIGETTFTLRPY